MRDSTLRTTVTEDHLHSSLSANMCETPYLLWFSVEGDQGDGDGRGDESAPSGCRRGRGTPCLTRHRIS
jgi:hypothetical protein